MAQASPVCRVVVDIPGESPWVIASFDAAAATVLKLKEEIESAGEFTREKRVANEEKLRGVLDKIKLSRIEASNDWASWVFKREFNLGTKGERLDAKLSKSFDLLLTEAVLTKARCAFAVEQEQKAAEKGRKRKHIEEEEVIDEGSASGSSYAQIGGEAGPKGSDSSDFVPIATLSSRKRRKTSTDKTPVVSVEKNDTKRKETPITKRYALRNRSSVPDTSKTKNKKGTNAVKASKNLRVKTTGGPGDRSKKEAEGTTAGDEIVPEKLPVLKKSKRVVPEGNLSREECKEIQFKRRLRSRGKHRNLLDGNEDGIGEGEGGADKDEIEEERHVVSNKKGGSKRGKKVITKAPVKSDGPSAAQLTKATKKGKSKYFLAVHQVGNKKVSKKWKNSKRGDLELRSESFNKDHKALMAEHGKTVKERKINGKEVDRFELLTEMLLHGGFETVVSSGNDALKEIFENMNMNLAKIGAKKLKKLYIDELFLYEQVFVNGKGVTEGMKSNLLNSK